MPPAPLLGVVVGRELRTALRARPARPRRVLDPHVHALLGDEELNPVHRPRRGHSKQMLVQLDVPHAISSSRPGGKACAGYQSPTEKPGEPVFQPVARVHHSRERIILGGARVAALAVADSTRRLNGGSMVAPADRARSGRSVGPARRCLTAIARGSGERLHRRLLHRRWPLDGGMVDERSEARGVESGCSHARRARRASRCRAGHGRVAGGVVHSGMLH